MSTREIYTCDWCGQDAPKADEHPSDWTTFTEAEWNDSGTMKMTISDLLCKQCQVRRSAVIRELRIRISSSSEES